MDPKKPQRVLIVDDEPDLLGVLRDLFTLFGYEVLTAINGAVACDLLRDERVDVVLTDVRMPVMDGIELVRRIRAHDRLHPIVMVTSGYTDHLPEFVYAVGANGFLTKPFGASGVRDAFVQAAVSPERRWSQPRTAGNAVTLNKYVDAIEVADELGVGTGGVFWGLSEPAPQNGQLVDFTIERPNGPVWEGQGIVRWTRPASADARAGCGIEFTYLADGCRAEIVRYIDAQAPVAYLPRR